MFPLNRSCYCGTCSYCKNLKKQTRQQARSRSEGFVYATYKEATSPADGLVHNTKHKYASPKIRGGNHNTFLKTIRERKHED